MDGFASRFQQEGALLISRRAGNACIATFHVGDYYRCRGDLPMLVLLGSAHPCLGRVQRIPRWWQMCEYRRASGIISIMIGWVKDIQVNEQSLRITRIFCQLCIERDIAGSVPEFCEDDNPSPKEQSFARSRPRCSGLLFCYSRNLLPKPGECHWVGLLASEALAGHSATPQKPSFPLSALQYIHLLLHWLRFNLVASSVYFIKRTITLAALFQEPSPSIFNII